jgi:hypothetical protein
MAARVASKAPGKKAQTQAEDAAVQAERHKAFIFETLRCASCGDLRTTTFSPEMVRGWVVENGYSAVGYEEVTAVLRYLEKQDFLSRNQGMYYFTFQNPAACHKATYTKIAREWISAHPPKQQTA